MHRETALSAGGCGAACHSESMQMKSVVRNLLRFLALVLLMSRSIVTRSTVKETPGVRELTRVARSGNPCSHRKRAAVPKSIDPPAEGWCWMSWGIGGMCSVRLRNRSGFALPSLGWDHGGRRGTRLLRGHGVLPNTHQAGAFMVR